MTFISVMDAFSQMMYCVGAYKLYFKISTAHLDLLGRVFTFMHLPLHGHVPLYILLYKWILLNLEQYQILTVSNIYVHI